LTDLDAHDATMVAASGIGFLWAIYLSWHCRAAYLGLFRELPLVFKPFGVTLVFIAAWVACIIPSGAFLQIWLALFLFARRLQYGQ
jgi:hypothetical protein